MKKFKTVDELISQLQPDKPVYCIRKKSIQLASKLFQEKFPGKILYAVKTNPNKEVLKTIIQSGIKQFDVASVEEIKSQTNLSLTDNELLNSPSIEETEISDESEELVKEVAIITGEEALSSDQESTLKINQRSKSLRVYAILLLLLVTIILSMASLFQPNKSEQNQ